MGPDTPKETPEQRRARLARDADMAKDQRKIASQHQLMRRRRERSSLFGGAESGRATKLGPGAGL